MKEGGKKRFLVFPCADSHEKIRFTTQKILNQTLKTVCSETLCISKPKGSFKRKKVEAAKKDLLLQSATKGEASNETILNIRLIKISKDGKVEVSLSFPLDKAGGKKTYRKEASKSLSISSFLLCLPASSSGSPR